MAKGKGKNVNSHIRTRLDYLHKAAAYFQSTATASHQAQHQHRASNEQSANPARTVPDILTPCSAPAMTSTSTGTAENQTPKTKENATLDNIPNLSRTYISHLRGISLKTQLRLPQDVKRSFCKRCDTLLVPGVSCMQEIRNNSRGGKKPWADVRVVCCTTCGTEKRYPQTERRSKKLVERRKENDREQGQKEELDAKT